MRRALAAGLLGAVAVAPAAAQDLTAPEAAAALLSAQARIASDALIGPDMAAVMAAMAAELRQQAAPDQHPCLDRALAPAKRGPDYAAALACTGFAKLPARDRDLRLRAIIAAALTAAGDAEGAVVHVNDFADFADSDRSGAAGILFEIEPDRVRIEGMVNPDAPPDQAIAQGETLVTIDGQSVAGLDGAAIINRLRGPVGSIAVLGVSDAAGARREVALTRMDWVRIGPSVTALRKGSALALRPHDALLGSAGLFAETPDQIKAQLAAHADADHLILDLRGNTGGVLDTAVIIADLFLAKGEIAAMEERSRGKTGIAQRWKAKRGDPGEGAQITIVVDQATAAGAELIAAAFADNARARIVGVPTYGRGSVQTLLPLTRDGYYLKLTTGRLLRPSGQPLGDKVTPDCPAGPLPKDLAGLVTAIEQLKCPARPPA